MLMYCFSRVARVLQPHGPPRGSSQLTDTVSAFVKCTVSVRTGRIGEPPRARAKGGPVEVKGNGQE